MVISETTLSYYEQVESFYFRRWQDESLPAGVRQVAYQNWGAALERLNEVSQKQETT